MDRNAPIGVFDSVSYTHLDGYKRQAQINLEADRQKALENNYDLQYSRRALNNMQENSTDKKNQERTVKNLEQSISASMTNLYNDIQQKKIAWQLAQAELATEQQSIDVYKRQPLERSWHKHGI